MNLCLNADTVRDMNHLRSDLLADPSPVRLKLACTIMEAVQVQLQYHQAQARGETVSIPFMGQGTFTCETCGNTWQPDILGADFSSFDPAFWQCPNCAKPNL